MDFQDLSSEVLVQLTREGQAGAFDALVKRYQTEVLRRVSFLYLDRSSSEDIVQDVFLQAFKNLPQYRPGTSFRNWLIGIAQNAVKQEIRRSSRYRGRLARFAELMEHRGGDLSPQEDEERSAALLQCMSRLEATCLKTVRARYAESRSIDEIAASMGRSNGAIRNTLYRARAHLRACLERKGVWGPFHAKTLALPAAEEALA